MTMMDEDIEFLASICAEQVQPSPYGPAISMPWHLIRKALNEIKTLRAEVERLRRLIVVAKPYIEVAGHEAECLYDDGESGYYMDLGQYEIMQQTAEWLSKADAALRDEGE